MLFLMILKICEFSELSVALPVRAFVEKDVEMTSPYVISAVANDSAAVFPTARASVTAAIFFNEVLD